MPVQPVLTYIYHHHQVVHLSQSTLPSIVHRVARLTPGSSALNGQRTETQTQTHPADVEEGRSYNHNIPKVVDLGIILARIQGA